MNILPMNNLNTPVFKGNKMRDNKLMLSDIKNVKSAVKSLRKPLGTVTNYVSSASKTGGKHYEGYRQVAKKIDFKEENRSTEMKEEQKPQKLMSFPVMDLVEEELLEIETMDIEPPSVDMFEDILALEEQPRYHLPRVMNWFPFDVTRRGSLDYSFVDDGGINDDLTWDEPEPAELKPESVLVSFEEFDLCFPSFD